MEEDIKILERLKEEKYTRETVNSIYEYFDEETAPYVLTTIERQAIENLIARNKVLEERDRANRKVIREYSECIPKSKVKEIIQKYYDEYEKEKEYRYTGDVEEEQSILREIEKELLQEGDKNETKM